VASNSPDTRAGANLALYHSPTCLYCMMTRRVIDRLGVEIELKNIDKDPDALAELIDGGGRRTVPCLRIDDASGHRRWMYESADIIAYLEERFAPSKST
jgi:glutaredoxin